jgi:hypothetical protein
MNITPGTLHPNAATAKNSATTPNYARHSNQNVQYAHKTTLPSLTHIPFPYAEPEQPVPTPRSSVPTVTIRTKQMTTPAQSESSTPHNTKPNQYLMNQWNPKHYEEYS